MITGEFALTIPNVGDGVEAALRIAENLESKNLLRGELVLMPREKRFRWKLKCTPDEEIVHCRDCVKREFDNCPFNEFSTYEPEDDFFCGAGSREWKVEKDEQG